MTGGGLRPVTGIRPTPPIRIGPIFPRVFVRRVSHHMKTIHIAEMIAQGGRDGRVEAVDDGFAVDLTTDEKPGSVTPEHLFAGAYAACYLGALQNAMEKAHLQAEGVTVIGRARLEEDDRGGWRLAVDLRATLPGVKESDAQHVMNLAHQTCPYSKATRGNINVNLSFD